ncbi:Endoplasmic reticulum-Golgi intermediate compartment protein 2 [Savitreella phatthalungensis]
MDSPPAGLRAFDAFPKVDRHYRADRTSRGAVLSIVAGLSLLVLFAGEFTSWLRGEERHAFLVDPWVKDHVRFNIDMTVAMACSELHINVQDATMDLIKAGDTLEKQDVRWSELGTEHLTTDRQMDSQAKFWQNAKKGVPQARRLNLFKGYRGKSDGFDRHADWTNPDGGACRIFGGLNLHLVEGDFHITAMGIGYPAPRTTTLENMNFTHRIDRLSFGIPLPGVHNPLDHTHNDARSHFHRFQYFLNVVPTTYLPAGVSFSTLARPQSASRTWLGMKSSSSPGSAGGVRDEQGRAGEGGAVSTWQYAVTESSRNVEGDRADFFPGIFFKYDNEPIRLVVRTSVRRTFLQLLVRLLGSVGGIVAGLAVLDRAAARYRSIADGKVDLDSGEAAPAFDHFPVAATEKSGYASLLDRRRHSGFYS